MTKEFIQHNGDGITVIKLKGYPYQQERDGILVDCSETLETLAINSNYESNLIQNIRKNAEHLKLLLEGGYYEIDKKIKRGESLTYSEAFSLMTFVSMGVNRLVYSKLSPSLYRDLPLEVRRQLTQPETILHQSIALLSAISAKEAYVGLSPEEIAGLTAATLEIDTIFRIPTQSNVIGIGGMGGDRGYKINGQTSKLFSVSTLGAVVLSNFGLVHKHHSYPNTSKVAGQSAIEAFGAYSDQSSPKDFQNIQIATGLLMTSCHTTRLIHTLSHRLKGETINHVVGPLSIPVNREAAVHAFIGVNDNVHPETVVKALIILQKNRVQKYANSVVFCGLNNNGLYTDHFNESKYYFNKLAKQAVAIDEVAPPPHTTLAAFLINGQNKGTFFIVPEDFMEEQLLRQLNSQQFFIPNTPDAIMSANQAAITGNDISKTLYLSMTGALALFTKEYAHLPNSLDLRTRRVNKNMLREAFVRILDSINSGKAYTKLQDYVAASKK